MKFPSKKDWWLTIIVWGAMLFAIGSVFYEIEENLSNIGTLLVLLLSSIVLPIFIIWIWLTTNYVLDDQNLVIRYGPFKKTIPLHSIKSVKKTMNPLSSPALSLKRLEISYGQYGMALISPKDREEFMKILAEKCPRANIKM
ncbi:PH domain-containing protein [Neobacillus sp. D3-1R]|uniref:PH domain-containing protein n=1 Tax=Neobacillus sp. D3-1R TaxID=3445778 RepID=UPI003FA02E80